MSGQQVTLTRQGRLLSASTTSDSGAVAFPNLTPGAYTLSLCQERLEVQCVLRAAEEGL